MPDPENKHVLLEGELLEQYIHCRIDESIGRTSIPLSLFFSAQLETKDLSLTSALQMYPELQSGEFFVKHRKFEPVAGLDNASGRYYVFCTRTKVYL